MQSYTLRLKRLQESEMEVDESELNNEDDDSDNEEFDLIVEKFNIELWLYIFWTMHYGFLTVWDGMSAIHGWSSNDTSQ